MSAAAIARAMKGQRTGSGWLIRCPCHDDKSPSCSIADGADGRLLVHCFAGCNPLDILAALGDDYPPEGSQSATPSRRVDHGKSDRSAMARALWNEGRLAAGSPVETYLRSRGLL